MAKLTALPMDSKEGVVIELRHGNVFRVRSQDEATGFKVVRKGEKVRVTKEYAEMLKAEHGITVPNLGWVSIFVDDGAAVDQSAKEMLASAEKAVAESARIAEASDARASKAELELAELRASLAAQDNSKPAKATTKAAEVVKEEVVKEEVAENTDTTVDPSTEVEGKAEDEEGETADSKATRKRAR